jgi:hypothetical protein
VVVAVIVLVTGARDHPDLAAVRLCVAPFAASGLRGVFGDARGVDATAEAAWKVAARTSGAQYRRFVVDWAAPCTAECKPGHRKVRSDGSDYCPAAGIWRNQLMVDFVVGLGQPAVCLAFPAGASQGTRDCMRRAAAAGLPVLTPAGTR